MTQKTQLQGAGDGTAVPAGYVGQVISAIRDQSGDTALTGNAWVHHASDFVTLSPGIWILYGAEYIYSSSTTDSLYGTEVNIGTVTGNNSTGFSTGHRGNAKVIGPSAAYLRHTVHTVPRVVTVTATTSYFIKVYVVSSTGGSWFTNGATLIAVCLG